MRKYLITAIATFYTFNATNVFAGNPDRSGQAAASELLINPWAATGGVFGMNGATVSGLEAMKLNVAGLANTKSYEIGVSHNTYMFNSGVSILDAGFSASLNAKSKIGINLMSMDFGNIPQTSVDFPQGIGTNFKPSFFNINLGYAYSFGKNINAGLNLNYVYEGISNVKANAVGFDAGIMYTTGFKDEMHFGVTLRNVGTNLQYGGDGLYYSSTSIDDKNKYVTISRLSQGYQLPTQLGISTAYDLYLGQKNLAGDNTDSVGEGGDAAKMASLSAKSNTRLTFFGSFISNAFINDYLGLGAEFGFREKFFLRAAYRYEKGITSAATSYTVYTGLSAGAGIAFKWNKESNKRAILDYAYKPSKLGGVHQVSLRLFN